MVEVFLGDSVTVQVPVRFDGGPADGQAVNLDGAAVEVSAMRRGVVVAGLAAVEDAPSGLVGLSFAAGDLGQIGHWLVQVKVTLSGVTQTVLSAPILVKASNF